MKKLLFLIATLRLMSLKWKKHLVEKTVKIFTFWKVFFTLKRENVIYGIQLFGFSKSKITNIAESCEKPEYFLSDLLKV